MFHPAAIGQRIRVAEPANQFEIALPLSARTGSAQLKISLIYYFCHKQSQALCKVGAANWTGQVTLTQRAAATRIDLNHVVR